jgi:hypothetical protein
MAVRFDRLNGFIVLLLAAFLLVQAELPFFPVAAVQSRACASHQCCCSLEMKAHGTCCCAKRSSSTMPDKSGCSIRGAPCGENEPQRSAQVTVRFEVILPLLAILSPDQLKVQSITPILTVAAISPTEPLVPPPRFLVSA